MPSAQTMSALAPQSRVALCSPRRRARVYTSTRSVKRIRLGNSLLFKAALKLQRWFRNCLLTPLWSASDAAVSRKVWKRGAVIIVEPCGTRYCFMATDLVVLFAKTAHFQHPITRRCLNAVELSRVQRALGPRDSLLVKFTQLYADEGRQAVIARDSLCSFFSHDAGMKLDAALCESEDCDTLPCRFWDNLESVRI